MRKKKIFLVITPFFPSNNSFVGSYVFDQVNEIRNQTNFNIEVIKVVSAFSSEKDYEFKGFRVHIFKLFDIPFFIFPGIFNRLNKVRFKNFLNEKDIEKIQYSHAHVSYPAAYLVEDLNCKKMVQHHGLDVLQLLNGRNKLIKKIQCNYLIRNTIKQLNKADLNIGVSKLVLQKLSEFRTYNPKEEYVLYNGVDISKFYPKKIDENNIFTIGCVANFWEIKDQITLIKSVQLLKEQGKEILLRLIGTGPTLQMCKNFVSENNLSKNIVFEKEIKHEELNLFFNEIDVFILPSYYEALGCVYMESWATNTPFIAVKGQGITELIPSELKEKLVIGKSDVNQLIEKIDFLMKNPMILNFNQKYNIDNTISEFLKNKIFHD
ncbi:MAG: glycosyltransferase family 4 protein [Flavobacteriales bacterium]|nr:glycosyltransferase family 4 protein [Flavobacteriales bacterium]